MFLRNNIFKEEHVDLYRSVPGWKTNMQARIFELTCVMCDREMPSDKLITSAVYGVSST